MKEGINCTLNKLEDIAKQITIPPRWPYIVYLSQWETHGKSWFRIK